MPQLDTIILRYFLDSAELSKASIKTQVGDRSKRLLVIKKREGDRSFSLALFHSTLTRLVSMAITSLALPVEMGWLQSFTSA